jgi:signal transduction histidine kinase
MKFFQLATNRITEKISPPPSEPKPSRKKFLFFSLSKKPRSGISGKMEYISQKTFEILKEVKSIGYTQTMDEYDRRKLSIFNQLNFFQLITGILVPITCLFGKEKFGASSFLIASLPAFISFLVLCLNFYYKHEAGIVLYFMLYPLVTSIVYLNGMNLGVELFFILYGILAVFFVQEISQMLFSIGLSMVSYFVLAVVCKKYTYQLQVANLYFYLFNQLTAIAFIFYGLFLIKKENALYQFGILTTNQALHEKNRKIQKQKLEIEQNADLLHKQTEELTELNSLKNKLFSVIAHDLKSPMYALRNLFYHIQQHNLPVSELRKMIPDVVNDLNYTTGLMENLLLWAKSQMVSSLTQKEDLNISLMIQETIQLLQLQANAKNIILRNNVEGNYFVYADKGMISLVIRNLLSNAIKYTPEKGKITVNLEESDEHTSVSVQDTGVGLSKEAIDKINQNNYFTTPGTASEAGTGLGLMLCKEFLQKNGGILNIRSKPGEGSIFSFSLSRSA